MVAKHYRIPLKPLENLPYCQRRARVTSSGLVYYGEKQTKKLLLAIKKALGESELTWVFDDHEMRLPEDVSEFNQLLLSR